MGTWSAFAEADVTTRRDSVLGAGAGDHLPIGYWSGALYRSALRFPKPPWADWSSITKATLTFYISDHQHVGVRNSSIYVRRNSTASIWTKAAGTQDCEAGFSAGNNTQADDLVVSTTNQVVFSSGTTANAKKSVSVTLMTREYLAADVAKLVYILDPAGSSDYTEIWSREKGSTYDAELEIEYVEAGVPDGPTQVAPTVGEVVIDQTPRFSWTHNSPNAQTGARVKLYAADGVTLINEYPVVGAANFLDWPDTLNRGQTYVWQVFTSNSFGESPGSAGHSFTIAPLPVVTIENVRRMTFDAAAHQPRLIVRWSVDRAQTSWRVQTASGYDSGVIAGPATEHTLARNLTNGTAENITVTVVADTMSASASRSFTPRWGLTTQRRDVGAAPVISWETPVIAPGSQPADTMLVIEYGASANAGDAAPPAWLSSVSAIPKDRYLFWRAWFIPSATQGPTLDSIDIPVNRTVALADKWGTTRDVAALSGVWSIDPGEAVYGTRSMRADVTGAGPFKVYAFKVRLRAGRTYILTGLMKSLGNSGAHFQLEDAGGNVLIGGGMLIPFGAQVVSPSLTTDKDWFDATKRDTNRYKTPTYPASSDHDAYVVLVVGGTNGAKAWFDAIKLEESSVATPWSPGAIGAVVVDAGGIQIDGPKGGVFRYRAGAGARDVVEGGTSGLKLGGDTELSSPAAGMLSGHAHATVPGVFAHGSAALALLNGTLKLDVSDGGRAAMLDTANNRFIVPAGMGGVYRVTAAISAANTAAGERHIAGMSKNGAGVTSSFAYPNIAGTAAFSLALDLVLAAGDVITFTGTSTVSADWTVTAASFVQVAAAAA